MRKIKTVLLWVFCSLAATVRCRCFVSFFVWALKLIVTDYLCHINRNIRLREDNQITFVTCKTAHTLCLLRMPLSKPYAVLIIFLASFGFDLQLNLTGPSWFHIRQMRQKTIRKQITIKSTNVMWYSFHVFHRWMQQYEVAAIKILAFVQHFNVVSIPIQNRWTVNDSERVLVYWHCICVCLN